VEARRFGGGGEGEEYEERGEDGVDIVEWHAYRFGCALLDVVL